MGGRVVFAPRPTSSMKPPASNSPTPTPDRLPRSRIAASVAVSAGEPVQRAERASPSASASWVPEPRPAWAGIAPAILTETSGGPPKDFGEVGGSAAPRALAQTPLPKI